MSVDTPAVTYNRRLVLVPVPSAADLNLLRMSVPLLRRMRWPGERTPQKDESNDSGLFIKTSSVLTSAGFSLK